MSFENAVRTVLLGESGANITHGASYPRRIATGIGQVYGAKTLTACMMKTKLAIRSDAIVHGWLRQPVARRETYTMIK